MDCLFCKIVKGEIESEIIYRDDMMMVLRDKFPQAPLHLLAIPVKHIESACDVSAEDEAILGHMMVKLPEVVRKVHPEGGIRIVTNCGPDAGQSIFHLHYHILGGRKLSWPPG